MSSEPHLLLLAVHAQLGLGLALIIITWQQFHPWGPDSCIFAAGKSEVRTAIWQWELLHEFYLPVQVVQDAGVICSGLPYLALVTIFSSLIISVLQGGLSFLGLYPLGVEVCSRSLRTGTTAVMWQLLDHHALLHQASAMSQPKMSCATELQVMCRGGLAFGWTLTAVVVTVATVHVSAARRKEL